MVNEESTASSIQSEDFSQQEGAEQLMQEGGGEERDWAQELERDKEFTAETLIQSGKIVENAARRAQDMGFNVANVAREAQSLQEELGAIRKELPISPVEIYKQEGSAQAEIEPVERQIIIPEGIELVSDTGSGYADLYVDRANKKAYRVVNPDKWKGGNVEEEREAAVADFNQKVKVGKRDTTGLTPRIYAYDPKTLTLEMEWIEGQDFTKVNELPLEATRQFMAKLKDFHRLGLYHGDMWPMRHYILTSEEEIRVVDNTFRKYSDTPEAVQKIQQIDRGVALKRFQELFGISEANLEGKLFDIQEQTIGEFKTTVDDNLNEAIQNKAIQFVYQRGIGFVDGNNPKTRYVETSDFGSEKPMFGSCVVVVAWSPEAQVGCVLHADKQTDLVKAKQLIQERFGNSHVELSIVGGQTNNSEGTLEKVDATFSDLKRWKLSRLDILGPKFARARQLVLDARTGEVYDLQGDDRRNMKDWSYDQPSDIKIRASKAALVDIGLIHDVDLSVEQNDLAKGRGVVERKNAEAVEL